ncbi:MAG: cell division protein SepF [Nanoarchaeota archaeon]|nr:cell division protein SepF [Nanoarchaeota archaeon]MBU4352583.1 cell division protein SepF [Nanoarchaeota archaeon]MBU4456868.1 cell division protein SepF [Nanoarchaeota archaeon]MCG2719562.1 cell division protein SepF [Nanoarchaeota archaeon]
MRDTFMRIKEKITGGNSTYDIPDEFGEDYLEIEPQYQQNKARNKVVVKPFVIKEFADVSEPLDALREGYTVALINIKQLKDKDIVELKRAVNKLKKTCDAINGDIAGFGEDWLVATPGFAQVFRPAPKIEE